VSDPRLRQAAAQVLSDTGWDGLTVEAVADAAGLSRVTAWRLGATKETLVAALLGQLEADYQEAMWPALTGTGPALARLEQAIAALFDVADAHLPLLQASDMVFHRRSKASKFSFNQPLERIFLDGAADGTIRLVGASARESADLLFNTVCWSYVHLRGRHRWGAERARSRLWDLVGPGLRPV
jgi:AcrR family transcriptional regulator